MNASDSESKAKGCVYEQGSAREATARHKDEHRSAAALVTHVDGLQLFLSTNSALGYQGVQFRARDRNQFRARYAQTELGSFDTAVEAARAYAEHMLKAHGKRASDVPRVDPQVRFAQGYELKLSPSNATGYYGVGRIKSGMVDAKVSKKNMESYLGRFATVVEAAVAVAKFLAGDLEAMSVHARGQSKRKHEESDEDEQSDEDNEEEDSEDDEVLRVEPSRASRAPKRAATGVKSPLDGIHAVRAVLKAMNLEQYSSVFDDLGYDELRYLASLDDDKLKHVATSAKMKQGHAERFVAWLGAEAAKVL